MEFKMVENIRLMFPVFDLSNIAFYIILILKYLSVHIKSSPKKWHTFYIK